MIKKEINPDKFKPKSTFNPRNKDAAIQISSTSQEEKLMSIEIPKEKYHNLTREERGALFDLKNDKTIAVKGANKGLAVAAWNRDDYLQDAKNQLGDKEIYEEVSNDPQIPY